MIPRRFIRTIPASPPAGAGIFWERFQDLHPAWEFVTYQDPIDPALFPATAPLWPHCTSGAQLAGLVRLEALWRHGGIYVDADVEPYRSFEPLLGVEGFAAWEDVKVVPDAVLGARAGHPAIMTAIIEAKAAVKAERGAWESGPGVTTRLLPGRTDFLLLPPGAFYPVHYLDPPPPAGWRPPPWAFARHHWAASWLTAEQKARNEAIRSSHQRGA